MRSIRLTMVAFALAVPLPGAAQSEAVATDTGIAESAAPAPKKKGGLFGKAKGLAQNKIVKAVVKTAACTMLPGGQVIAGAIDAADSKDAAGAAAGAAGAAVTGQTSCMPGGLGAAGLTGAAADAAAAKAVAGAYSAPAPGMPMDAGEAGSMEGMPGEAKIARCLGLTPEEYRAFTDPTGGQPRQPTNDEMKRQAELSKKIDMRRYQACMMQ